MPDGLIFDLPDCDAAPEPAHLAKLFSATDSEIVLHLAISSRQDQGLDCDPSGGSQARYGATQRELRDDTQGLGEYQVSFARKNLMLLSEAQLSEKMVSFPLASIVRDGKGGFAVNPEFIPPCLRIGACEKLVLILHGLLQTIDERIASTRSVRLSSGRLELGTSALDVANYWFLHALCSALPALRHHLQDRRSHPERVYSDLVRLAGALSTFSLEAVREEIPPYRHRSLTSTFKDLDALIRRYLEVVVPSNSVTLQFRQSQPYIHVAEVKDERCLRRARWIFGIRAEQSESLLLRQTPRLVKICSAEGVAKLVQRALPGMELMHLSVPPAALHAQADMHYFSVSLDGPCWQHVLQTRKVGVYVPGELGKSNFDLTVILESSA